MHLEGGNECAVGEQILWIPCKASCARCARVLYSADHPLPRAPSFVDRARHDTRIRRSVAPFRAMGASVPGAVQPSLCACAYINVTSRGAQVDALASYKGDYPGKVSYCSTTLIPHLKEKIGSKCMDFVKVEEEGLEDRRSRICNVTTLSRHLWNGIDMRNMHPGARTPQYSDKSSTTSFDARARGHRRCDDREFCS